MVRTFGGAVQILGEASEEQPLANPFHGKPQTTPYVEWRFPLLSSQALTVGGPHVPGGPRKEGHDLVDERHHDDLGDLGQQRGSGSTGTAGNGDWDPLSAKSRAASRRNYQDETTP